MDIYSQISIVFFIVVFFVLYKIFKKENEDNAKSEPCHLTEYERLIEIKTRKKWLISFMVMSLISMFLVFFTIFGEEGGESVLLAMVVSTFTIIPWFWMTYYCSFKKRGTAWLSWTMVMIPLRELVDISKGEWSDIGDWNSSILFLLFFVLGIKAYYLFNCYKLRYVNLKRNTIESNILFNNSTECAGCVSKMENSQDLNELNEVFGYSVRKWPHWEKQISRVYKKRKERLLENVNV